MNYNLILSSFGWVCAVIFSHYLNRLGQKFSYHVFGFPWLFLIFLILLTISCTFLTFKITHIVKKKPIYFNKFIKFFFPSCLFLLTYSCFMGINYSFGKIIIYYSENSNKNSFDELINKIINLIFSEDAAIILGLIVLIYSSFYPNKKIIKNILNVSKVLGISFLILFFLRIIPTFFINDYYLSTAKKFTSSAPKVIWLILDEWDYNYTFKKSHIYHLKNLQNIVNHSIFLENAFPPARDTTASIPALILGKMIDDINRQGPGHMDIKLHNQKSWIKYPPQDNIFSTLKKNSFTVSLLGNYHPYCHIFKQLDYCSSIDINVPQSLIFRNNIKSLSSIKTITDFLYRESFLSVPYITEESIYLLPSILARQDNLFFAHLNLPHPPSGELKKPFEKTYPTLNDYDYNLLVMDDLLGKIVNQLHQQNSKKSSTYLILTTDHWLRSNAFPSEGHNETQPIPFIVKNFNDPQFIAIKKPFNTMHTRFMIENILLGNLKSNAEISTWIQQQLFFNTWNPGAYYHY
ncbi:MAG: sulfatase-like hydrolase/transferase [Pseudomonadota bacterium]